MFSTRISQAVWLSEVGERYGGPPEVATFIYRQTLASNFLIWLLFLRSFGSRGRAFKWLILLKFFAIDLSVRTARAVRCLPVGLQRGLPLCGEGEGLAVAATQQPPGCGGLDD